MTMLCFADGLDDNVVKAELELVSWTKVVDVMKDGGVIKRILNDSSDYKTATAESNVKLRFAFCSTAAVCIRSSLTLKKGYQRSCFFGA